MQLSDRILRKYWRQAIEEQVAANLEGDGFQVHREVLLDQWKADLVATSGNRVIVYEFKTPDWDRQRSEYAKQLRNHVVHHLGGDFRLAWVAPPVVPDIEIDGIEGLLLEAISDDLPSELDALSYATRIEEVGDVTITELALRPGCIEVTGDGVVAVDLTYGSPMGDSSDDGLSFSDSYPFKFRMVLGSDLRLDEVVELHVDTSSYYE